ncbi:hypothetical protein [Streptomyces europaeiscabiei]|uniref:hypothetical protein n=1 Tax=Streptomyces europaeiscabiei TaxID=146819 RepID=UPI0029A75681|nr:hypothetical protein [Streptomyces europaeiscabiei]MDX2761160.1 hypothetical protein [Streptomyces europaeiscabiei]
MAWDEWEQLKTEAAERQSTHMQLNQADGGGGGSSALPEKFGVLKASQTDLSKVGRIAHTLYNDLWDKARVAVPSSDSAASDLSKQGFALGSGLKHVSTRWEEQLKSLMDAVAHISNHMHFTTTLHSGDDGYIQRQMSSIDALDAGFDERVGKPGEKNSIYYPDESKKKE